MAHNTEVGGSGGLRSLQLSYDEADILYWQRIPAPLQFKLSHGWHLSNAGYVMPSAGTEMRALIAERQAHMTPAEQSQSANDRTAQCGRGVSKTSATSSSRARPASRPLQPH
jgi:hypothetical protein